MSPSGIGRQHTATRSRQSSAANGRFKHLAQFVVRDGLEEHDLDLTGWCLDLTPDAYNDDKDAFLLGRPAQLAELPRSEFDPELFSHSAFVKLFCDIRDKSAVFNILQQNMTTFDIGNGFRGRKKKRE